MRRAARTDANHEAVMLALRNLRWAVVDTSRLGAGFPDLVVARRGVLRLLEVKDGTKPPSRRTLTPAEAACHALFRAGGVEVVIIESVEDAVRLV